MELTPNQQEQDTFEQKKEICREILVNARNELYLSMHFLDLALSALAFVPDGGVEFLATDGDGLYYSADGLMGTYLKSRVLVNRGYLHCVVHCLFAHMDGKKDREEERWNIACDIAAEHILDGLYFPCVHKPMNTIRRRLYRQLETEIHVLNAEKVYRFLEEDAGRTWPLPQLAAEFTVDSHRYWQDKKRPSVRNRRKKWDDIRDKMETEMETFSKEASDESRSLLEQVRIENREKQDYKEFLRKFCVLKETMQVDTDSFDYIYYDYGMRIYGNMPLIEPLETKEVRRIEDFVIVIDTSMSCSGELVRKFLEQTYAVLTEAESFFTKINVHILQCDEQVRSDRTITSRKDLEDYMNHMEIRGLGGTDFRPAFAYVEELLAKKTFGKLKGLIYFTDGYGIYPAKMPPYDTAFVFMKEDYNDLEVPGWAIKLVIDPEDLGKKETL